LNKVITETNKMLGRLIGENIRLVSHPSHSPVLFKADRGQVEQVLINLATNSRDAMPDGGTLTLRVDTHRIETGQPTGSVALEPGDYAVLTVTDTGTGMDDETVRRAFEPFFTTKGPGEGTGLGLATVYGMVKRGGGEVVIRSTPGEGTTVEVWYPTTTEAPDRETEVPQMSATGGTETILVVEDESTVATLVYRLLRREGYTVLQSHNGLDALDLYEARHDEIDLVLSDVVMPAMGGPEMIRILRERGHNPLVIFASGYSDERYGSLDKLGPHAGFLHKPYTPRELLRHVRHALDRNSAQATPRNE
jgi:CheY-like chemotaxis protein